MYVNGECRWAQVFFGCRRYCYVYVWICLFVSGKYLIPIIQIILIQFRNVIRMSACSFKFIHS